MADDLLLVDGTQAVVADTTGGSVEYLLAVRVDGMVTRAIPALLGPALNALYGQALAAVLVDPTLGGLAMGVSEGVDAEESGGGMALEVEIGREAYSASVAAFGLHLTVRYELTDGAASTREGILAALSDALTANVPTGDLTVRERVLSAFAAQIATAVGTVERNAERPAVVGADPVVVLCDGDQDVDHGTNGLTWYTAHPAVEVFVPGSNATTLDTQVQLVRDAIRSAGSLGGLVHDVEEASTDPEVLRTAYTGPCLAARLEVVITYATTAGDPYEVAG